MDTIPLKDKSSGSFEGNRGKQGESVQELGCSGCFGWSFTWKILQDKTKNVVFFRKNWEQ